MRLTASLTASDIGPLWSSIETGMNAPVREGEKSEFCCIKLRSQKYKATAYSLFT
jgi:hypothetical protein